MDKRSHQRLIGATVLVSLGVIFIPMLFDSPEFDEVTGERIIPAEPREEFVTLEIPLQLPEQVEFNDYRVIESEARISPRISAPQLQTEPHQTSPDEWDSKPGTVQQSPVDEPAAVTTNRPPEKPLLEGGWVVQLASFSVGKNALALRDQLRSAGYQSYVEESAGGNGLVYRVRVGPELREEQARKLHQRLAEEFKLNGMVMNTHR